VPEAISARPPASASAATQALHRLALISLVALTGCAAPGPHFVSSPLPAPQDETATSLTVGDLIEVDYFPTTSVVEQAYRISVEDRLRIDVAEHPQLSREQLLVLPDGTVSAPEVGRIAVAGKTVDDVVSDLTLALRRAYIRNPRVTVGVQEGDTRLRSLINRRADNGGTELNLFQISDNGRLQLPFVPAVDALRPIEVVRADIAQAYRRLFGDRLEVTVKLRQARPRQVFVMGEVGRPGSVEYAPTLTSLAAVAAAGGLLPSAQSSTVVLYRQYADGRHSAWLLDLHSLLADANTESQRIAIRPNDVLYVPKTGIALANDVVEQYIRRMLPLPANVGVSLNVR